MNEYRQAANDDVRTYWNSRAGLGQWAGSRDVIAKQLEIAAITSYVRDGMRVLEVGCGNGITAIELARRYLVNVTAFDYAQEMVVAARTLAQGQSLKGTLSFEVGDVTRMPRFEGAFDLVYTERVLINLPDWDAQRAAIGAILTTVAPGGVFVMCENSQDGLDRINLLREPLGLPRIDPPWHNRYMRDAEIARAEIAGAVVEHINHYSATYYFLSRVVNAAIAAKAGREPEYESDINQLALSLPPIGEHSQGRIWLWRKGQ